MNEKGLEAKKKSFFFILFVFSLSEITFNSWLNLSGISFQFQ